MIDAGMSRNDSDLDGEPFKHSKETNNGEKLEMKKETTNKIDWRKQELKGDSE